MTPIINVLLLNQGAGSKRLPGKDWKKTMKQSIHNTKTLQRSAAGALALMAFRAGCSTVEDPRTHGRYDVTFSVDSSVRADERIGKVGRDK